MSLECHFGTLDASLVILFAYKEDNGAHDVFIFETFILWSVSVFLKGLKYVFEKLLEVQFFSLCCDDCIRAVQDMKRKVRDFFELFDIKRDQAILNLLLALQIENLCLSAILIDNFWPNFVDVVG